VVDVDVVRVSHSISLIMATYFGEVVERSSRAFWGEEFDSEDDIESNSHKNCR